MPESAMSDQEHGNNASDQKPASSRKPFDFKKAFIVLFAFAIIAITLSTRLQSLDDPHLLEFDTMYFHNIAEEVAKGGEIPEIESDRYYPLLYDGGDYHVPTYSVAFLCKINPFCLSEFEGVKAASKWYAPIFTTLTIIALIYLGYRAGKDWIIGALLFAIVPGALFRSVAGFTDKDTAAFFFMVLSIYFVYRYMQEKEAISSAVFGSFAGVAMGLAAMSLSAYVLYVAPVIVFEIFQVLRQRAGKSAFGLLPFVTIPILMRFFYGNVGGLPFLTSTINLAIYAGVTFVIVSHFAFSAKSKIAAVFKAKQGKEGDYALATAVGITAVIFLAGLFFMGLSPLKVSSLIAGQFLNPLRSNVHGSTVGENQPTSWAWPWEENYKLGANSYWNQLGAIFPISISIIALLFLSGKDEDILTAMLLAFNIYAASRGVRLFVNLVPIAALATGRVVSFIFRSEKRESLAISGIAAFAATAPFLFFSPSEGPLSYLFILAFGGAVFWGAFSPRFSPNMPKVAAVAIALLLFVQLYPTTSREAKGIRTSVNSEWFENFKWSDQNMAKESPILAWWDYGYWIQYFARRPSVADGGNRIMKINQELGLMFTESDEDKAADWMTTLSYPSVTLSLSKGERTLEYSNDVFAKEFYERFVEGAELIDGSCEDGTEGTVEKTCASYALNATMIPSGEYAVKVSVNYRGAISSLAGTLKLPEGDISSLSSESYAGHFFPYLKSIGDETEIVPKLSFSEGKILFGYEPFENILRAPRIMTHDATMVGKMAASSSIASRLVQYVPFQYLRDAETPLGNGRIYTAGQYFIAIVDQNGTALPLIGVSGSPGVAALSSISTYEGVYYTNLNSTELPKDPGAVILAGGTAIYATAGGESNMFTRTYILDGAGTQRFREVFSNGFAKSFYVV